MCQKTEITGKKANMNTGIKKIIAGLLVMVLILGLTACSSSSDGSDEASANSENESDELLFDPEVDQNDIQDVVYLQGSWYEMGCQYAESAAYSLNRFYTVAYSEMLENAGGDKEVVYDTIEGYMDDVKEQCPDLYDFVQGVADTSELFDFTQAAIATVCYTAPVNGAVKNLDETCENISAWGSATADGHLLAATNGDTVVDDENQYCSIMVLFPDNGYSVICSSGACSNANMNSQGVILLLSGGQHALEEDEYTDQLTGAWMTVYLMTQCATADEAIEMEGEGIFITWLGNTHIVDTDGNAYVIESTASHRVVRASGDYGETDYLIANNHYLSDEMQSSLYNDGSYDDCPVRYDTVEQIYKENFGSIDIGIMHEAIASRRYYENGEWSDINWSLGLDTFYSSDSSNNVYKTTIRTLLDATDLTFYRQLGSSDPYNNAVPNATARFCKLILSEDVASVNLMAGYDASLLIWYASRDLSLAEEKDETLEENLNIAKSSYQEGSSYGKLARLAAAEGDTTKALSLYGKATSAYCKAQEYAQNAMIEDNTYTAVDGESYTR